MLYKSPYQFSTEYLATFNVHPKMSEAHNGSIRYIHNWLQPQYWRIITSMGTLQPNIRRYREKIKAGGKYPTCMLLIGTDSLNYKQLKKTQKNYIVELDGYTQDLPVVMKLINNYI